MRALLIVLFVSSLSAAATPTMEWLPLSNHISWSNETPAPSGAGLVGRALGIVVVDFAKHEGPNGRKTYYNLEWPLNGGRRQIDFRQMFMILSVSGPLPAIAIDKKLGFLQGEDSTGLLRALTGNAVGVFMVVNPQGRVVQMERLVPDDLTNHEAEIDAVLPLQNALVADPAKFPASCAPVLDLLKQDNLKVATTSARKIGADGAALLKAVEEQIDTQIVAELALLGDGRSSTRFIARGQLVDLLAEFPGSAHAADAAKALKATAADKALASESAAWAALNDYLTQAGKAPPKKLPDLQKRMLAEIIATFPDTYGAELAGMIRKVAQVQ